VRRRLVFTVLLGISCSRAWLGPVSFTPCTPPGFVLPFPVSSSSDPPPPVSVQRAIPDSFFGVEFTGRSSVAPTFCWLFPVDLLGPLVFSPTCSSVPLGCTAPTSLHFSVGAASGVLHLIFCSPVQLSADILHTGVPLTMAQRWWPLYSSCSCVSRKSKPSRSFLR
jgi:hypothetical protein